MSSATVVEAIDVLEQGLSDLLTCLPLVPPDEFGFECFEECFNDRIVVTISLTAHRYFEDPPEGLPNGVGSFASHDYFCRWLKGYVCAHCIGSDFEDLFHRKPKSVSDWLRLGCGYEIDINDPSELIDHNASMLSVNI